jgi:hypothetical protein
VKWIIRYIPDGMYAVSKRMLIHNKFLAAVQYKEAGGVIYDIFRL